MQSIPAERIQWKGGSNSWRQWANKPLGTFDGHWKIPLAKVEVKPDSVTFTSGPPAEHETLTFSIAPATYKKIHTYALSPVAVEDGYQAALDIAARRAALGKKHHAQAVLRTPQGNYWVASLWGKNELSTLYDGSFTTSEGKRGHVKISSQQRVTLALEGPMVDTTIEASNIVPTTPAVMAIVGATKWEKFTNAEGAPTGLGPATDI